MLQRSDIMADERVLQDYYDELRNYSIEPLWNKSSEAVLTPPARALPHLWRWSDVRPLAIKAVELVGTKQAERRVLRLMNPALHATSTTATIFGGIQIVMPGEIARAHQHTMAALRMVIESSGGYTVVNGDAIPMLPGDLILTPSMTWHDHANDTNGPMIWLDGLDSPLVESLEAAFQEEYERETQPFSEEMDLSFVRYGGGGDLQPAWLEEPQSLSSPLLHYPWLQAKARLDRLSAAGEAGSQYDDLILEYRNPVTGGPVMPTMGCRIQMLRPGRHTLAHRHNASTIYHVIEGEGATVVEGKRLTWSGKDVFCIPASYTHEHVNSSSLAAYLFSFTNEPALRALGLYREEFS